MVTRCVNKRTCCNALRRCRKSAARPGISGCGNQRGRFQYSTYTESPRNEATPAIRQRYDIFNRLKPPTHDEKANPSTWIALLEPSLPEHLREHRHSSTGAGLDAEGIAEILLAAQRLVVPARGIDILFQLGIVEGRWSAVVWIVKRLVEAFGGQAVRHDSEAPALSSWRNQESLDEMTSGAIEWKPHLSPARKNLSSAARSRTLEELTDDVNVRFSRRELLQRDALGQVWRSIGRMTIACVDSEIKPEILEIIAYLHHMGIMPLSIYNQHPSTDVTVIQQPPTLNLFSSRILTSLSDAAWRAHAKLVIEEAKVKGGDYAALRPEIPGAAYRVHIAGLRPEVWLELILWSCLHGGWIIEGHEILRTLYLEPLQHQWKSLSWRSLLPATGESDQDWEKLTYSFNTQSPTSMDMTELDPTISVHRTISSEVVEAYVDALLSAIRIGVGERGVSPGYAIEQMRILQKFLDRSGLSLSTGSWDAVILRFLDSQRYVLGHKIQFEQLLQLSPTIGEELDSPRAQQLPAYILDGSAAMLGLFHRALQSRITAGDMHGAFRLFQALQKRADSNKHQSIADFLQKQHTGENASPSSSDELFTSNFSGIDFPAFDVQIPSTILGPFLDLITDAKAYDFGKWLLYNHDLDGPVIPERIYGDPALAPGLVRFAAETGDASLLSRLIQNYSAGAKPGEPTLPRHVLQSFLDSQINLKRWDAAERILHHLKNTQERHWNIVNLAQVARIMLLEYRRPSTSSQSEHFRRSKDLFYSMVHGKFDIPGDRRDNLREGVSTLIAMLSTLDTYWAEFCLQLRAPESHCTFGLPTKAFNSVLGGVVGGYGSVTGRRVLGIFWPRSVRDAQLVGQRRAARDVGEPLMSRYEPSSLGTVERQRSSIRIALNPPQSFVMYGGTQPDLMTIRVVFRRALKELKDRALRQESSIDPSPDTSLAFDSPWDKLGANGMIEDDTDYTASGTVVWAIRCLRYMHIADDDILEELQRSVAEKDMQAIRTKFPKLFQQAASGGHDNASTPGKDRHSTSDGSRAYLPFEG